MLTTAGAARATASAKLGSEVMAERGSTGAATAAAAGVTLCAAVVNTPPRDGVTPSNDGFHHTSKKAPARPMMTALAKKPMKVRAFCN
jgi:hypothetical protein